MKSKNPKYAFYKWLYELDEQELCNSRDQLVEAVDRAYQAGRKTKENVSR